jgi:poly(hydroxyalkanoate) depolymerase family esterase
MVGLSDTLTRLSQVRRRLNGLLGPAGERSAKALGHDTGVLNEVTGFGSNPGHLRMLAYTPKELPQGSALVVALHGCTQAAAAYDYGSGWSTLADRHQFALLLPEQQRTNNPNTCFTWFHPAATRRNGSEALSISEMIEHMIRNHGIDRSQVFIIGLSAGGAMTAAMLAAYPEVFAGGAIIAGLPHGAASTVQEAFAAMAQGAERSPEKWGNLVRIASAHRGPWPRLSIWHGAADPIVNPRNAEQLIKQWTNVHGVATEPDFVHGVRGHTRRVWCDETGAEVIEAYSISGMGHGVPVALIHGSDRCGNVAAFHFDVGLCASSQIIAFWGIGAARATLVDDRFNASLSGTHKFMSDGHVITGMPMSPTITDSIAENAEQSERTTEELSSTHSHSLDARDVITAALRQAGLLVSAGSQPAIRAWSYPRPCGPSAS